MKTLLLLRLEKENTLKRKTRRKLTPMFSFRGIYRFTPVITALHFSFTCKVRYWLDQCLSYSEISYSYHERFLYH